MTQENDVGELLKKVPPHPLKTFYQFFAEFFTVLF